MFEHVGWFFKPSEKSTKFQKKEAKMRNYCTWEPLAAFALSAGKSIRRPPHLKFRVKRRSRRLFFRLGGTLGFMELLDSMSNLALEATNHVEETSVEEEHEYSSDEEAMLRGERWPPLGATDADLDFIKKSRLESCSHSESWADFSVADSSRLLELEEEQEQLNNSLLALTTHFAQVQFRLRQIVEAPADSKEELLKELETFASRGIPDPHILRRELDGSDDLGQEQRLAVQREKQHELIEQLKAQLQDLEQFAYETGDGGPPQTLVMERQKFIIEELRQRMDLHVDNIDKLSPEELKSQVEKALAQLVNPLKLKDQLLTQLKTQVTDLERFIEYLQGEEAKESCKCACSCPVHGAVTTVRPGRGDPRPSKSSKIKPGAAQRTKGKVINEKRQDTAHRITQLLQLLVASQLGCGIGDDSDSYRRRPRPTPKGNHWGDVRARLELAVNRVCDLARVEETVAGCDSDDSDWGPGYDGGEEITKAVRKELATVLRDLIQHGLYHGSSSTSLVPLLGCFRRASGESITPSNDRQLHAWNVIMFYYEVMNGDKYVSQPQRSLAHSFRLDVVGSSSVTLKQALLSRISAIVSSHAPYKRSPDAQFKAFVCAGLNDRKLAAWLRLIYRCPRLIEGNYLPWSYAANTGFDDALRSLEQLKQFEFHLPEDLAIRPFRHMKDAF